MGKTCHFWSHELGVDCETIVHDRERFSDPDCEKCGDCCFASPPSFPPPAATSYVEATLLVDLADGVGCDAAADDIATRMTNDFNVSARDVSATSEPKLCQASRRGRALGAASITVSIGVGSPAEAARVADLLAAWTPPAAAGVSVVSVTALVIREVPPSPPPFPPLSPPPPPADDDGGAPTLVPTVVLVSIAVSIGAINMFLLAWFVIRRNRKTRAKEAAAEESYEGVDMANVASSVTGAAHRLGDEVGGFAHRLASHAASGASHAAADAKNRGHRTAPVSNEASSRRRGPRVHGTLQSLEHSGKSTGALAPLPTAGYRAAGSSPGDTRCSARGAPSLGSPRVSAEELAADGRLYEDRLQHPDRGHPSPRADPQFLSRPECSRTSLASGEDSRRRIEHSMHINAAALELHAAPATHGDHTYEQVDDTREHEEEHGLDDDAHLIPTDLRHAGGNPALAALDREESIVDASARPRESDFNRACSFAAEPGLVRHESRAGRGAGRWKPTGSVMRTVTPGGPTRVHPAPPEESTPAPAPALRQTTKPSDFVRQPSDLRSQVRKGCAQAALRGQFSRKPKRQDSDHRGAPPLPEGSSGRFSLAAAAHRRGSAESSTGSPRPVHPPPAKPPVVKQHDAQLQGEFQQYLAEGRPLPNTSSNAAASSSTRIGPKAPAPSGGAHKQASGKAKHAESQRNAREKSWPAPHTRAHNT